MIDYDKPIKCVCGYETIPNKWHDGEPHSPNGMTSFMGWEIGKKGGPCQPMQLFICPECGTVKAIFR
jgi:hypothetical protein